MALWNPFKNNKAIAPTGRKSFTLPAGWYINGGQSDNNQMTIKRALSFYNKCAPVATAIDWINDEFKTLPIVLTNGKDIEKNSEILDFLKSPNDDMTQEDFLETLGAYFLTTNEVYLIATGNPNRKPAELLIAPPQYVTVKKAKDGFVGQFELEQDGGSKEIFKRTDKGYRFMNADNSAEMWQIKGLSMTFDDLSYNGQSTGSNISPMRGTSKLSSIHKEINQYMEVADHNLSVLDNGLRPSGVIETPENATLDDEQFERLRQQIVDFYSGANNAGKTMILDNGLKFIPSNITPKDMDFKELTKTVSETIFKRYKIPMPLIEGNSADRANMDTAKLNLYDNCVIPLATRLLRELTIFLAPRFNLNSLNENLTVDLENVPALQIRRIDYLKVKKELQAFSINETRTSMGYEPRPVGCDDIYIDNRLVPAGTVAVVAAPAVNEPIKSVNQLTTRKNFTEILQKQLDIKGNRVFSDLEITEIADNQGL